MSTPFVRVVLLAVGLIATSCAGGSTSSLVDGVEISTEQVSDLHVDFDALDDDDRAGSLLLLILREAFGASASADLGLTPDASVVDDAYQERVDGFEGRGGADVVLAAMNQTSTRLRVEAELDTIRDGVSEELVRTEAAGFDLDRAYEGYLLIEAEVCIRQMQLPSGPDFELAVDRLDSGEAFADVARDVSIDPFVGRDEGVGAGGDLGCSPPNALPEELGVATLTASLNEPTGPVVAGTALYLLEVYERSAPDLADVRDEVIDFAVDQQGPDLFRSWAIGVLQDIDVEVASEFGSWGMLPETDPVPTVVPDYREGDIIAS